MEGGERCVCCCHPLISFLQSHHLLNLLVLPGVDGTNGLICGRTVSVQTPIINGGNCGIKAFAGQVE